MTFKEDKKYTDAKPQEKKEKTFIDLIMQYHDSAIEIIAGESEIKPKVLRLEGILRLMHVIFISRGSQEYFEESKKFLDGLENGIEKNINIYGGESALTARFMFLIEFFALMLEEFPVLKNENLSKVSFQEIE